MPHLDRPVFRAALIDGDQNRFEIDGECVQTSGEDTKKSFDLTGELKKLNESVASDRASFVELLEIVFKTPAKIDLHCGFRTHLQVQAPPVPGLPLSLSMTKQTHSPVMLYPPTSMPHPNPTHNSWTSSNRMHSKTRRSRRIFYHTTFAPNFLSFANVTNGGKT